MRVIVTRDPEKFANRAREFLEARIERNVLATVLGDILEGRYRDSPPLFAYAAGEEGDIAAAALRTLPGTCWRSGLIPNPQQRSSTCGWRKNRICPV
jgi:hypothetical protein